MSALGGKADIRKRGSVIGVLSPAAPEADATRMNAIREGLKEIGYVEGENVRIEYRSAENQL
jgi:putative ABC transport system substrate-binding protein